MTTYYVDVTTGDNADTGLTEALAWATITYAATQVAAGDIVYVKASATYTEGAVTINTPGTSTSYVQWIGYETTPGDRGKVTWDGTGAYTFYTTVGTYQYFENWKLTGASSHGFSGNGTDYIRFVNCEFYSNGGAGCQGDNYYAFINCLIYNNTGDGLNVDSAPLIVGCKIYSNTGGFGDTGVAGGIMYKCSMYNNGIGATEFDSPNSTSNIIGCTFDGDGSPGSAANFVHGQLGICVDNIIHDYATGIKGTGGVSYNLESHNLFSSVTTPYERTNNESFGEYHIGDITGAPAFIDEAGDDYRPSSSSPAVDAQVKPGGIT